MKIFKGIFSTAALAAMLAGTSVLAQQDVRSDYDHSYHFNKIKSYSWVKVETTDPLVEPRLTAAVDKILLGEGWHQVDKNPSVVIAAVEATHGEHEYSQFYRRLTGYSWRRSWGNGGFMSETSSLNTIPVGTLVIDMYDPATKKLVWRATAAQPTDAKVKTQQDAVDKTVMAAFHEFPWKAGGATAANNVEVPASNGGETPTGTP